MNRTREIIIFWVSVISCAKVLVTLIKLWEIMQGMRVFVRKNRATNIKPKPIAEKIWQRVGTNEAPFIKLIICPKPKVRLETITATLMFSIALKRRPRKMISSKMPTKSILPIKKTESGALKPNQRFTVEAIIIGK